MLKGITENIKEGFLSIAEHYAVDLSAVASFVKCNCSSTIPLAKPNNCSLRICGQDGTVYAGDEEQLEAWKDFYLPERKEMEVIGAIDYFPCDAFGLQLVLLLCEDGKVYAYEDEVLHLVAKNLKELLQDGMVFPAHETFKLGEYLELTDEEYSEIMESEDIKAIKAEHQKFRESLELELLESLNEIKQSRHDPPDVQKKRGPEDLTGTKQSKEKYTSCKHSVVNGKNTCTMQCCY
ncbi:uncharacterized protein [Paramisgurnus dabryanus]|uniref:uncharacterized protein n=1 Tax=Paramisgurnus dabryanus TaxID=90735 RepID=UPI0031F42514